MLLKVCQSAGVPQQVCFWMSERSKYEYICLNLQVFLTYQIHLPNRIFRTLVKSCSIRHTCDVVPDTSSPQNMAMQGPHLISHAFGAAHFRNRFERRRSSQRGVSAKRNLIMHIGRKLVCFLCFAPPVAKSLLGVGRNPQPSNAARSRLKALRTDLKPPWNIVHRRATPPACYV